MVTPISSLRNKASYFLKTASSDTVNFFLPLARRAANTLRPFAVAILSRNPCLFALFLLEGWNVRFIIIMFLFIFYNLDGKDNEFFLFRKIFFKLLSNQVFTRHFCRLFHTHNMQDSRRHIG